MITNKDIICISSIDWDFVWQGHQEIMSSFAANGNRVLFIENTGIRAPKIRDVGRLRSRIANWRKGIKGIRQEAKNLFICSPLILPFPYLTIARYINRFLLINSIKTWMRAINFKQPIIWTFLPTSISLDIIDRIDNSLSVYYCIADFAELSGSSKKVEKAESQLLKRCDVVFAQGEKIKERCLKYNANVHIFPFGVNERVFSEKRMKDGAGAQAAPDIDSLPGKKIGYIGGVHKHVDVSLLRTIALKRRDWSIVLVGPMQIEKEVFKGCENIYMLGKKEFDKLPMYILKFDVCLIPYLLNEYTKTVYPTKLNEYLAMGKPVISTPMPEVKHFREQNGNIIEIADTAEGFCEKIESALKETSDPGIDSIRAMRRSAALRSSWSQRIENMSELMELAMERKQREASKGWRDNFVRMVRVSKNKILALGSALVIFYLLIFHTPLLWWAASPLLVENPVEKSDAIVVLGGGVGESGRPGQGYEERVGYAAGLYKDGYAGKLILSSGFIYALKEADVMKALAVSLGVAPGDILLETKAANTYENVRNSLAIADKNGYRRIIFVSSPYHMRRLEVTAQKLAKSGDHFIFSPIPNSIFYGNRKSVSLKHIRAIVHEYLGILYYKLKGYA